MSLSVAIVAPGEMGSAIARELRQHGVRVLTSLAGRSEKAPPARKPRGSRSCRMTRRWRAKRT